MKRLQPFFLMCALSTLAGCETSSGDGEEPVIFGSIATESAGPGSVNGTWTSPGVAVDFMAVSVSEHEAIATFSLQGAQAGLMVDVTGGDVGDISWQGVRIDGYGALTAEEEAALDDLLGGPLWDALATVPIELACRDAGLDPPSMAALVLPLQVMLKYRYADRTRLLEALGAGSACAHLAADPALDERPAATLLNMSRDAMVPVVYGFFPFDGDGAREPGSASILTPLLLPAPLASPIGPCNALCRGACGADCSRRNCTLTRQWRCVQAATGGNTGRKEEWNVFNCGVHPGCVWHDQCFDTCNAAYPCGSWYAALCRHNPSDGCDVTAADAFGYTDCVMWAHGWGTFTHREDFTYPVAYSDVYDDVECPASIVGRTVPDFNICRVAVDLTGVYTDSAGQTRTDDELLMVGNWHNDLDLGGKPVYFGGMSGNSFVADLSDVAYAAGGSSGDISLRITFDPAGRVAAFSVSRFWVKPYGFAITGQDMPAENPADPFADDRFDGGAYDAVSAAPMIGSIAHTHEDYISGPSSSRVTYTLQSYTLKSVSISCAVSDEVP